MPPFPVSVLLAAVLVAVPHPAAAMTVAMEVTDAGTSQDASFDGVERSGQPTSQACTLEQLNLPEAQRRYSTTWSGMCRYDQSMLVAASACHSWSPSMLLKREWMQLEVPKNTKVRGVVVQGILVPDQGIVEGYSTWVTQLKVEYSDGSGSVITWTPITKTFSTYLNSINATQNATVLFDTPVTAQFIRLLPTAWQGERVQMRAGVLQCTGTGTACSGHVVLNPNETQRLYSSTFRDVFSKCAESAINASYGWCTDAPVGNQWVQLNLDSPQNIEGISTQGVSFRGRDMWVSKFRVEASTDGNTWKAVTDATGSGVFTGNRDHTRIVDQNFSRSERAKHIRIIPTETIGNIGMRVALLACRQSSGFKARSNKFDWRKLVASEVKCSDMQGTQCFTVVGGCIMLSRLWGQTCNDYCKLHGLSCLAASESSLERGCGNDPPPMNLCQKPAMDAVCWCDANKDALPARRRK